MTFYRPIKRTATGGRSTDAGTARAPAIFGGGSAPGGGVSPSTGGFGTGSRQGGRTIPERIPPPGMDYLGSMQTAVSVPAHVLERPLAILNQVGRAATGGAPDQPGPVDTLLGHVGDIGFKDTPVSIAGLWGGLGGALGLIGDFVPAIMNSGDAQLMAEIWNKPDSMTIAEATNGRDGHMAGGGLLGIGGHQMTVKEFKDNLDTRGFNRDKEGNLMSWQDFAAQVTGDPLGSFQHGNKAVNDNEFVNLAMRLATDPLNLAFGLGYVGAGVRAAGAVGKAIAGARVIGAPVRYASWATNRGATLASAAGRLAGGKASALVHDFGGGYLSEMASKGIRTLEFAGPRVAGQQFAAGKVAASTLQGVGWAMRNYPRLFKPLAGEGALWERYSRGALRTEAGLLGTEFVSGALADANVPIISGFMSDVHDTAQAFLEDKPLSEDHVFILASAFTFHGITLGREAARDTMLAVRREIGDQSLQELSRRFGKLPNLGFKGGVGRALKDPTGRLRGTAKEVNIIDSFGGEDNVWRMFYHMDLRLAFKRLYDQSPAIRHMYNSFDSAMEIGSHISEQVKTLAEHMRARGEITPRQRVDLFEEWARGKAHTAEGGGLDFNAIKPEQMIEQWRIFDDLQAQLGSRFATAADGITGVQGRLSQESLQIFMDSIKAMTVNGRVPTSVMTRLLTQFRAMFEDGMLTPSDRAFWQRMMNEGVAAVGDAPVGGLLSRLARGKPESATYDAAELLSKLEGMKSIAPKQAELYGEAAAMEARVFDRGPESGPIGRPIYSAAKLREYREIQDTKLKEQVKTHTAARNRLNQDWGTDGAPKAGSELLRDLEARDVRVKPEEYDAIRARGDEILSKAATETAPPAHLDANRGLIEAEFYTRAQEPYGGATYNPRNGEFINADATLPEGPYASAIAETVSIRSGEVANRHAFQEAFDRLINNNRDLLERDGTYVGVFHDTASGRIDFDINILVGTKAEAVAVQTALGRTGGAFDFTTKNGVFGVNPDWTEWIAKKTLEAFPNMSAEEAAAMSTMAHAVVQNVADHTGLSVNTLYSRYVGNIERGLRPTEEAMFQRVLGADELRAMIDEPPPQVLVDAGMSGHAPLEWTQFPDSPVEIGIPGGLTGLADTNSTFSLWDMWRLKAQAINPQLIPEPVRNQIYNKLFRSHVRSLQTDSLDSVNRMLFALQSPNQNLLANEAIYSQIRWRNMEDVADFAKIYDDVIAGTAKRTDISPKTEKNLALRLGDAVQTKFGLLKDGVGAADQLRGVNTISSRAQLGNSVLLAKRYLENPDFFLMRPNESYIEYVERLAAITPGAAFKVSNFGIMLGNPVTAAKGTMDVHMAAITKVGTWTVDAKTGVRTLGAPEAQSIDYRLSDGRVNPRIPSHLRNLPGFEADPLIIRRGPTKATKAFEIPTERMPEGDYVYHATQREALESISQTGLEPRAPALGPGSKLPNGDPAGVYFGSNGEVLRDYIRPLKDPVVLRVSKANAKLTTGARTDGTQYATKVIGPNKIEYLAADGTWKPMPRSTWEPPSATVYGAKYQEAHEVMEKMYTDQGIEGFDHGGFQWLLWDVKRGGFEPHSLAYPGAYALPKMSLEARQAAMDVQARAGYRSPGALEFDAFRPSEGFLYQTGDRSVPSAVKEYLDALNEQFPVGTRVTASYHPDRKLGKYSVRNSTEGSPGAEINLGTNPQRELDRLASQRSTYRQRNQGLPGQASDRVLVALDHGPASIVAHEYGHALYRSFRSMSGLKKKLDALIARIRLDPPSGRALDNLAHNPGGETFSEAFAAVAAGEVDRWGIVPLLEREFGRPFKPIRSGFSDTAVRGETQFVNDVKGIMRGFKGSDVSTAVHEWAHVWRRMLREFNEGRDLLTLESHYGVVEGKWLREQEELFARHVEEYLASGMAPNPSLQNLFDQFKDWLTSIYAKVRGRKAVTIEPEVKSVLDKMFAEAKSPDKWRSVRNEHQANVAALREDVRATRKELRAIDDELEAIRTVKVDPRYLDHEGNPRVTGTSLEELQAMTRYQVQHYPGYTVEPPPRISIQFRPEDSHIAAMMTERNTLANMVINYGPLSKIIRIVDSLTKPVQSSKMNRDSRQMVMNKLLPLGAKATEVRQFFKVLAEKNESLTTTSLHQPLFRGMTGMPPNAISHALRVAFEGNEKFLANFERKYGLDRAHVMLDESFNSAIRKADQLLLEGKVPGPITGAFRAGYYAWTTAPILRNVSDATRMASKVFYPMFRFQMDIRWQTLNMIEADILAFFRDGFHATRWGREGNQYAPRGPKGAQVDISANAAALHLKESGVPTPEISAYAKSQIGKSAEAPRQLMEEAGVALTNRHLFRVLKREFNIERPETIMKVLDELPKSDPTLALVIKKFGPDRGTWSEQLAETLYSFDTKGVRHTVEQAGKTVQRYQKWTPQEARMMAPLLEKITSRNQQLMDDLLQIHIGNINRSRLERVMNSYWLYWPISYQIKTAKWMVDIMTRRSFGGNYNFGGAWTIDRMGKMFMQQANVSPEFQQQLEDMSPVWFAASMLLPIAPWDPGTSLNKYVRYTGGNILGLWPEYSGINTPQDWALKGFEMGPIYTIRMAQQLGSAFDLQLPFGDASQQLH